MTSELEPRPGWVEPGLAEELPALGLLQVEAETRTGRTPAAVRERLRLLSDRMTGADAIVMRQRPVPWAYRVLFRQIGIDPDDRRTPVEQAALDRMRHGGFRSSNVLDDALLIATVETGVALTALDEDSIDGDLGVRLAVPGERLGGADGRRLSASQIVIADRARALEVLFGDTAEGCAVTRASSRMRLAAVLAPGVPGMIAEEALWIVSETLSTPG